MTTDPETGKVTGELVFPGGIKLAITGVVTPATNNLPEGIELTAEGLGSVSSLRGYFIRGATVVIAGIVVAVRNDLAKEPIGTRGSFVMLPAVT